MITLKLYNSTMSVPERITVSQLAQQMNLNNVVGCILDGKVHDLNYQIKKDGSFEWIIEDSPIGFLMKERTLIFLFITAAKRLFNMDVRVRHTLASGLYITPVDNCVITNSQISMIQDKMNQMILDCTPISRRVVLKEEAIKRFDQLGRKDLARLLSQRTSLTSSIYTCEGVEDYFYGVMATHAGMIKKFTLLPYQNGVWLSLKDELVDQPKLFSVFERFEARGLQIGITNASDVNDIIAQGKLDELIQLNEQRVDQDLSDIAQKIHQKKNVKVILIAGPSSAGKTTSSKRLAEKLTELGHHPMTLSMDDFFKNRVDSPRLPDGSYDYENIECLDLNLFNNTMKALLNHEAVKMPIYEFSKGEKIWPHPPVTLSEDDILIIEGIHALNPRSSELISENQKIKIYINALTHLNFDEHNRIPTSDYRLIRRMIRDHQFRGRDIATTIEGWHKVRDGEDMYIYPYQEEADIIFNTSMDYELSVIKSRLMPLLNQVSIDHPQYIEVNRIRKLLDYFVDGDPDLVPAYSILKEFLGGSIYQ